MARLLRIDSSVRQDGSVSRTLADVAQHHWEQVHPDGQVVRRDLGRYPLPHLVEEDVNVGFTPAADRTPEQAARFAINEQLAAEVSGADAILISVPLYNWSIPSTLKTWVDRLFLVRDEGSPATGAKSGTPVLLTAARGGAYGPGTPREGWDFAEPYLRRVLGEALGLDVTVVASELTLAGVNPALAEFKELGEASHADALRASEEQGRRIATKVASAV
jgi:FMN-dependent NADH-azoreductase